MPHPIEARAEEVVQRPAEARSKRPDPVVASLDADHFACSGYAISPGTLGTVSTRI